MAFTNLSIDVGTRVSFELPLRIKIDGPNIRAYPYGINNNFGGPIIMGSGPDENHVAVSIGGGQESFSGINY